MKAPRIALYVFLFLLFAAVVHAACYYPFLPEKVASHFGPGGEPDGWSTKQALIGVYLAVLAALAIPLLLTGWLLPKLPASMINLPHKKYWLAPERKAETCLVISRYFFWFASATIGLVITCMDITFRFNLGRVKDFDRSFWVAFLTYVVFTVIWSVALLWRFRKPPAATEPCRGESTGGA